MRAKLDKLTGNLRESDLPSGVDLPAMQQQAHRHDNKSVLDKFSESDGKLLFDGAAVTEAAEVATQTANGLMSKEDKAKLDKFGEVDGALTFNGQPVGGGTVDSVAWEDVTGKPSTFPSSTHQHAISDVTGLQDVLGSVATQSANGLMSAADKVKLDGLGENATQAASGLMSKEDKAKLDGLGGVATQSANGLMSAADKTKLDGLVQAQIGSIALFSGSSIPTGYLLCDGSALSREVYAELFDAIGTAWGEGDGETTFNLPDLTDKTVWGGEAEAVGGYKEAGLPNITGQFRGLYPSSGSDDSTNGSFSFNGWGGNYLSGTSGSPREAAISFNAARSNAIYGKSTTVQPPAAVMQFCIKYM